ncbi:MAG: MotA/TolQ/ExbB proton channel family protein [Eubacteriales bacterium]|nr:MotA/TolQ/ExbB proton channel family protein [Clostridiales bacterium]MDD7307613.1 MotA/TolQ/ExbB proton channel family protein [Eubacteriales bacterium]MDY2932781.1 MotA/TolQ/ExbB proton channel family protein [Anaerovoracaceae bacterium]MEE0180895.1 MotA/TolQ/ExbB proton channel family protein [Anaerovoracaceae bacterium]
MTILGKVLHSMTSVLQIPVVIILILFIAAILVAIGWIISEYMNEHKHMQVQLPKLLDEIRAGEQPIEEIIETSGLLKTQKEALIEITKHSDFNDLMLESLAANLLEREQERYDAKLKPTDLLSKLGPMFGLLGTLIPLGPGIIALGQGDTMTLSQSLMTAFDTTIAGLIVAAIAIVISTIRRGWYNNYMSVLETVMDCVVEMEKNSDD